MFRTVVHCGLFDTSQSIAPTATAVISKNYLPGNTIATGFSSVDTYRVHCTALLVHFKPCRVLSRPNIPTVLSFRRHC